MRRKLGRLLPAVGMRAMDIAKGVAEYDRLVRDAQAALYCRPKLGPVPARFDASPSFPRGVDDAFPRGADDAPPEADATMKTAGD